MHTKHIYKSCTQHMYTKQCMLNNIYNAMYQNNVYKIVYIKQCIQNNVYRAMYIKQCIQNDV